MRLHRLALNPCMWCWHGSEAAARLCLVTPGRDQQQLLFVDVGRGAGAGQPQITVWAAEHLCGVSWLGWHGMGS